MVELKPWHIYPMCEAIREFLKAKTEASPSDFYHEYKLFKKNLNYMNVARYFWLLHKIGLVRRVRTIPLKKGMFPKSIYTYVPERLNDDYWIHPQDIFPSKR